MHRRQADAFPGIGKTSQGMVTQREVPIASFDIGAGALEHLCERCSLVLEPLLRTGRHRTQHSIGLKKRGLEALGQCAQRLAIATLPSGSDTLKRVRGNQMRMHGVGLWLPQVQLVYLRTDIRRDKLRGRAHLGHHTCCLLPALQARLAQSFLRSAGTDRVDLLVAIARHPCAVTPDASLQGDAVGQVANRPQALAHLLPLLRKALTRVASRCHLLRGLRQPWRHLWGTARTAPCMGERTVLRVLWRLLARLCRHCHRFFG
jgi:hypothetical protein